MYVYIYIYICTNVFVYISVLIILSHVNFSHFLVVNVHTIPEYMTVHWIYVCIYFNAFAYEVRLFTNKIFTAYIQIR